MIAALAMLIASVVTGTALAVDDGTSDAADAETVQSETVAVESDEDDDGDGGDVSGDAAVNDDGDGSSDVDSVGSVVYEASASLSDDGADTVAVTVTASAAAFDEDVTLEASLVEDGDTVVDALADADVAYDGLLALDVRFVDADGVEVEPGQPVDVTFELPAGALGGDVDASSIVVSHLVEDSDGNVTGVDTVADAGDVSDGTVALDGATTLSTDTEVSDSSTVTVGFTVDSFSTFTVSWSAGGGAPGGGGSQTAYFTVTIHYVDERGTGIDGPQTTSLTGGSDDYYPFSSFAGDIDGYTYSDAHYNSYNGTEIAYMSFTTTRRQQNQTIRTLTFYNDSGGTVATLTYSNGTQGANVYLVYAEDSGTSAASGKVKVYVYVRGVGLSSECLRLLGIDSNTLDSNNYFPAGEIYMDSSFFESKGQAAQTDGAALINSENDWNAVLDALGELDTSTLIDMSTAEWRNYPGMSADKSGAKNYTGNIGNSVGNYLEYAEADIDYTWGDQRTALFKWHADSSEEGNVSYGFADQTVQYHLDLNFSTKDITYVYGNNGIGSGTGRDGSRAYTQTQITGTPIQEATGIAVPEGWYFAGFYTDQNCTDGNEWNGIGDPLSEDTTVYIKLVKEQVMTLSINKEIAWAEGTEGTTVSGKTYSFTVSTKDATVNGQSYRTSGGGDSITFTWDASSSAYTAKVSLTASTQDGADGTVLVYGLPANNGSGQQISYTVTEDTSTNVALDGYTFEGVTYSGGTSEDSNTVTASGTSSTASSSVLATNTYAEQEEAATVSSLPMTGGSGTGLQLLLSGGALGLLGVGVWLLARRRNRMIV